MNVAIITGASSGLGKEYFYAIAKRYDNIDEIWLVARRRDRLEKLASDFREKKVAVFGLDLCDEKSYEELQNALKEKNANVKILINNAGCGKLGNVADETYASQTLMIDLNCRALTAMCVTVLPYMNKGSYILNVCSIASFAPNPRMTVYSSTKAYVASFSKSLREELKSKKINVCAVCPGPMKTEFLEVAEISGHSKAFETLPYCNPQKVAEISIEKAERGKAIYTPTFTYKIYRVVAKILPHNIVMKFAKT